MCATTFHFRRGDDRRDLADDTVSADFVCTFLSSESPAKTLFMVMEPFAGTMS